MGSTYIAGTCQNEIFKSNFSSRLIWRVDFYAEIYSVYILLLINTAFCVCFSFKDFDSLIFILYFFNLPFSSVLFEFAHLQFPVPLAANQKVNQ